MISFVEGKIDAVEDGIAVINVNGIGFGVMVPLDTAGRLMQIGYGENVRLYTYMYIREDAMQLYGFLTKDELHLFEQLITVSGIGPKGALSLISAMGADGVIFAVMSGDAKALSKAPGVGKKTAERIIIDLKDKLELRGEAADGGNELFGNLQQEEAQDDSPESDAAAALTALGYGHAEAVKAVRRAKEDGAQDTEALLKGALRYL